MSEEAQAGASEATTSAGGATESAASQTTTMNQAAGNVSSSPEGMNGAAPAPATYTPNFKFKVRDVEKEFDDFIRPIVKDAETEKKLRDLYSRAHGLDFVKSEREELRNQFETLRTDHTGLKKNVDQLGSLLRKNDFGNFFEALRVPKQEVFRWVANELKYMELPPDQKAEIDRQRRLEVEANQFQEESKTWKQKYEEAQVQSLQTELNHNLQRPDVAQVAEAFDQRLGAGAFRNEVIKRGQIYYHAYKQHIPVEQAVREVMNLISANSPGSAAPQTQVASQGVVSPESVPQDKKPVIPNIQGRGTSPAKKVVKSVKDLKALAKKQFA